MRGLISQGLAVSLVPELGSEVLDGVALRPVDGPAPERDVYVMVPSGGRHPLALRMVAAFAAQL
jgi:DNA-binding transcriptional LysR family regulator